MKASKQWQNVDQQTVRCIKLGLNSETVAAAILLLVIIIRYHYQVGAAQTCKPPPSPPAFFLSLSAPGSKSACEQLKTGIAAGEPTGPTGSSRLLHFLECRPPQTEPFNQRPGAGGSARQQRCPKRVREAHKHSPHWLFPFVQTSAEGSGRTGLSISPLKLLHRQVELKGLEISGHQKQNQKNWRDSSVLCSSLAWRPTVRPLTRAPSCGSRPSPGPARTSSPRAASTGRGTFCSSPADKQEGDKSFVRAWSERKRQSSEPSLESLSHIYS